MKTKYLYLCGTFLLSSSVYAMSNNVSPLKSCPEFSPDTIMSVSLSSPFLPNGHEVPNSLSCGLKGIAKIKQKVQFGVTKYYDIEISENSLEQSSFNSEICNSGEPAKLFNSTNKIKLNLTCSIATGKIWEAKLDFPSLNDTENHLSSPSIGGQFEVKNDSGLKYYAYSVNSSSINNELNLPSNLNITLFLGSSEMPINTLLSELNANGF